MITVNDIGDRLEELVRAAFPEEEVHRELCPAGFTRPCNLIVLDECSVNVSLAPNLAELQPTFTITTFAETDEYYHSHLAELHKRQAKVLALFLPGFIKVGSRAPKVGKLKMGGGYDYDTVTVTFTITIDRAEFIEQAQTPTAENIETRLDIKYAGK
jgi:hypothetical protein